MAKSLRKAIDASGLSMNRLAKVTDIPLTTLWRRYKGVNPWDAAQIEAVAKALDADPWDLLPDRSGSSGGA